MTTYGLLIIGSGPAGVSAAEAYADAGGPGPVALPTADPHAPYERPPLSKNALTSPGDVEPTPITEATLPDGVDVRLGATVTAVDLGLHDPTANGLLPQALTTGDHLSSCGQ